MALKVDLPEELTPAYFKKHLEASAPTGALLNKHLVTVTKAHTSIDWKAFDVPGSGKASELEVLHKALKAEIDKSVAAATAAAKAASTEGDKVLAAMKKGKAPGKALEAAQKLVRNAQAYAASLVKQTDAAAAELAKKVTAAGGQAAKDEAKKDDAKAAAGGAYDKALKLMKSRTMPWLRTVRANNPELPTPCFMAALSPTGGALMLNKAVGGAEKKVLGTLLPGQKGVKFFRGTVVWEARALTFVSASPPSGAAKKLQLAMRQMLKLNLKVRVRKPSGEVEEEEGDDISQFTDDGVAVGSIDPAVALKALAQRYEAHKAEIEAVCKMTAGKESKLAQALRDKLRAAFQDKAVGIATATMDQLEALILSVRVVDEDASEFADADSSDEAAVDTPTEGAAPDAAVVDPAAPAAPAAPADAWAAARKLDAQLAMVMQALGKAVPGLPAGASKKMIPMALEIMAKQRVKAMAMAKPAHAQTELTKLLNACKTMAKASQITKGLDFPAEGSKATANQADAGIAAAAKAPVGELQGDSAGDTDAPVADAGTATATPDAAGDPAPMGGPVAGPTAADPKAKGYEAELKAVRKMVADLKRHQYAAHVTTETTAADGNIADAEAAKPDWAKAMAELKKARTSCADGRKALDGYGKFMKERRAPAAAIIHAARLAGYAPLGKFDTAIAKADTEAAAPGRDYAKAGATADGIVTELQAILKKDYVDDLKPRIAALKTGPQAGFLAQQVKLLDAEIKLQDKRLAAKAWRELTLGRSTINGLLLAGTKMGPRRAAFDVQRPLTVAALAPLKADKAMALPAAALDKRLTAADKAASFEMQQMDSAERELKAIAAECKAYSDLKTAASAYTTLRKGVADGLALLDKHKAAAKIDKEREAVRKLLTDAAAAALDKAAPGVALAIQLDRTVHRIGDAMVLLRQAQADLKRAQDLAAGLGGVVDAEAATAGTVTVAAARKGLDALSKELADARKDTGAALAAKAFDDCKAALDDAKAKIDAKEPQQAAQVMTAAALKLAEGRRIQVEHAAFIDGHKALADRLTALQNLSVAAKLAKPVLDFKTALDQAQAQDTAGAYAEAMAGLHKAELAAAAADAAVVARVAFDKRDTDIRAKLAGVDFAAIKVDQVKAADAAVKLADALDFSAAEKGLDAIEVAMTKAEALKQAKQPFDAAKSRKMVQDAKAKGGNAAVDALIKSMPDDCNLQMLTEMASERFGMAVDADQPAGSQPQKAVRRMCELMALVNDDVVGNKSIATVSRRANDGAYYDPSANLVVMNSRPEESNKADFQPGVTGRLPADREPECLPANNNPEDLFDFNMVHEAGHGVDDSRSLMASKGKDSAMGGWITHGGEIASIAAAVAETTGYNETEAQRTYIHDLIAGNPVEVPVAPEGKDVAWAAALKLVDDWHALAISGNVWSNEASSVKLTMKNKRVYHQSYGPGTWVSYEAAARKRGITGYQFRAPGEWFSELYAAFKLKKLKPSHPSHKWLSELKV